MDLDTGRQKMNSIIESFKSELAKLRTGRATPELLKDVEIEVYESMMPIEHIATITVPDAKSIIIKPWDESNLKLIEKAIASSDLGLNPIVESDLVKIFIPALTKEVRESLVKELKEHLEHSKVVLRGIRHKMLDALDEELAGGGVSEDDIERRKSEIEKEVETVSDKLEQQASEKEQELMNI